jgi:glycosyltransferase involved in cell wall biosynthesis
VKILYHHRTQGEEPESVHIASIVQAMRDLGHEVVLLGPAGRAGVSGGARGSWLRRVKRRLPRAAFELVQLAHNLPSWLHLRRALRRERPAFVYERYALHHAAGVLAAGQAGVPLVLEVNTPYAHAWSRYYGLGFPRLARSTERFVLGRAPAIITVSEAQRRFLEEQGVPPTKIAVCHNAIDPAAFDADRYPTAREDLGIPPGPVVVGFVGTMNRWQGIDALGQVLTRMLTARSDVWFLLVGDGEKGAELRAAGARARAGSRVVFTGRRAHAEVPALVAAMDVAVLPDSNRSPMKIFEYMAMGKAVVAPRVPPVQEVVRDGETGLLISPGDAQAMEVALLRLAADPGLRRALGESSRRYVLAERTWRHNALRAIALYERLAAGDPTPAA